MVKAQKYVYVKAYDGEPKRSDLEIMEEDLPPIEDGEYLAEALYISVDPYIRAYANDMPVGTDVFGGQIAKVTESKNKDFPVETLVYGHFGWRTFTVVNPNKRSDLLRSYALPDFGGLAPSLGLGVLGMPGVTAYFGFLEICQPKSGETLVVSGAAGAVGSLVGQIAKLKGLKVIGFAGSDEKVKWLTEELGFDHAFNYKKVDFAAVLKKAAPDGIDCYFDNVGGELSAVVMSQMNKFGRISLCGVISTYNSKAGDVSKALDFQRTIISKELKAEGFLVSRWSNRWMEGIEQMLKWIQEGKLKYNEHITEGFEHIYDSFVGMLRGENKGKALVKV